MDPFDLVGDVLDDQYRIDECAGEGVLSVVYRGRHLGVDADVAVKCLNLPPTMDEALAAPVAEAFRQGCKLHYRLARGNLHIAQTIASGTTIAPRTGAVVPYLVREWFEGESLAKDFTSRREAGLHGRTLEEVLDLFQGAADALRYAHSQGISHLSLTPSNFFVTQARAGAGASLQPSALRTIKVLDFGVGRIVDETASDLRKSSTPSPGLHLLQPAYAAPEQLSAQIGVPGPASDVYVFALVLLEALSDRIVMDGKDTGQLVTRALDRAHRPSPKTVGVELPPQVTAIFERAFALDPTARHANVGELWEELLQVDVELTSSSRDPSLPPPNFDEEEPTAEMPMEMLEPLAAKKGSEPEVSASWEASPGASARLRGPSLFRRLRHWKTLGARGKSAAEEAERDEGPITMPPPISVAPPKLVASFASAPAPKISQSSSKIPAAPRAPAIPSWHPDPVKPKPHVEPPTSVKVPVAAPLPKGLSPTPTAQPPRPTTTAQPPRPTTTAQPPRPFVPPKEAPKPIAKAPDPPPPPAPAPPVPAAPQKPPPPKRQPTLVMFEHGVDVTAAARTSSPSSPGLRPPSTPDAPAPPVAAAPPLPTAPPPAPEPPPPIKTPAKPLPPPPPAELLSTLEGMEAIPISVPPAAPASQPRVDASPAPLAPPPAPPRAPDAMSIPTSPMFIPSIPPRQQQQQQVDPFAATLTQDGPLVPPAAPAPAPAISGTQNPTVFTQVPIDPPPPRRRALLATIVSFVVVLALGIVLVAYLSHRGTQPTPQPTASTIAVATSAPPSATAPPSASAPPAPSASVSAAPSASVAPDAGPPLPTQPKFFKNLATKALDKVAKDLTDCRDKKALWGQSAATVYFQNDGTVKDVSIAHPYYGRPQGKCVEDKIRTARMAPFLGKPYPVVYYFIVPR